MSPLYFKKPLCGFLPSADRLHRLISIAFDTVLPQASIISRVKIPRVTLFTGLTFLVVLMDMVRDTTPGILVFFPLPAYGGTSCAYPPKVDTRGCMRFLKSKIKKQRRL